MSKLPAIFFYPNDWLADDVARCSLAAQGLWLRMLILAHGSKRYGYLSQNGSPIPPESIARACGCTPAEYETLLTELVHAGVPSRTPDGTIYSRRMVKDAKLRAMRSKAGKSGGNPNLTRKNLLNQTDNQTVNQKHENESIDFVKDFYVLFSDQNFSSAWESWAKHHSEINRPLTPTAMHEQLSKLAARGAERAAAAIRHSIAQGYTGIYEEQTHGNHRTGAATRTAAHFNPGMQDDIDRLLARAVEAQPAQSGLEPGGTGGQQAGLGESCAETATGDRDGASA